MMIFCYFCTFFKQLLSMQEQGGFDSSSLQAFQSKSQVGCFCKMNHVLECSYKNEIENKFSVLNLLDCCQWFYGVPCRLWKYLGNQAFSRAKVCYKFSNSMMVDTEKSEKKLKLWRCHVVITLCVASLVFPTFSVIKVVYHEYPRPFCVKTVMQYSQDRILG